MRAMDRSTLQIWQQYEVTAADVEHRAKLPRMSYCLHIRKGN